MNEYRKLSTPGPRAGAAPRWYSKNTYATQEHREALPSGVTNRAPGDKVATKPSVCAAVLV